jgi:putative spermidine/putrescine transport system substrate-binding protein
MEHSAQRSVLPPWGLGGVAFRTGALWLLATASFIAPTHAQNLTITNFGGANGAAQEVAFLKPFARATKIDIRAVEHGGELGPIRDMVQRKKLSWDVVEIESTDLKPGCDEGLFEKIDRNALKNANILLPGAVQECGIGAFVWSTVLAYDASRFKDPPRTWKDFWNVEQFPGKRGLRKGARYNMEIALMADGVSRWDVYDVLRTPEGTKRALDKLEKLKPHIVWWESGSQPPQRLISGETSMTTAFNGRVAIASKDSSAPLNIVWKDAIYELDFWAIVKGSPRQKEAYAYLNFVTSEDAQLAFAREIPYGPTNMYAILRFDNGGLQSTSTALATSSKKLPSLSLTSSLPFSATFWNTYSKSLEASFAQRMY